MTSDLESYNVCVPVKLDAFVLNLESTSITGAKIAPITQPNYTFLRLSDSLIQHDVLDHVDLHNASELQSNRRLTDFTTQKPQRKRMGVYVHWSLPRVYRSGIAATSNADQLSPDRKAQQGYQPVQDPTKSTSTVPDFRPVPNRWLVVRRLNTATMRPASADIPEFQGFVIQNDGVVNIDDMGPAEDIEVQHSPFIAWVPKNNNDATIAAQAEIFIGSKCDATVWSEAEALPSVPITTLNSSNHLFADYQPHNGNVFSMLDDFKYGEDAFLDYAEADYYVLGWHADATQDPFFIRANLATPPTHAQRLKDNLMVLKDPDQASTWLSTSSSTQSMCHGAMYSVTWSLQGPPAPKVPADDAAKVLGGKQPIAIGANTMDALVAYAAAHIKPSGLGDADSDIETIEEDLIALSTLLLKQEDDPDSLGEAKDMLYEHNFTKSDGGTYWYLSGKDPAGRPSQANPGQVQLLSDLNKMQTTYDMCVRQSKLLQWKLFSKWWQHQSDPMLKPNDVKAAVDQYTKDIATLNTQMAALSEAITAHTGDSSTFPVKQGARDKFLVRQDPTVVIGGMESGWPLDYLDLLKVRLDAQLMTVGSASATSVGAGPDASWSGLDSFFESLPLTVGLGTSMAKTMKSLLNEWRNLRPHSTSLNIQNSEQSHSATNDPPSAAAATAPLIVPIPPLFHDQESRDGISWRDKWEGTQPWFPLFMEWKADYYHLDYHTFWTIPSRGEPDGQKVEYQLAKDVGGVTADHRLLSGRVIFLPQVSASLKLRLQQLFDHTPCDVLDAALSLDKRKALMGIVDELHFFSAPLSGITDHLLTKASGTHIKPNVRPPGQLTQPISGAVVPGLFESSHLSLMDAETSTTPYSNLSDLVKEGPPPMKPVTHGQLRLTELNIIDKFGQAVTAIDPRLSVQPRPKIYPCTSERYRVQPRSATDNHPNIVDPDASPPDPVTGIYPSEFIQLPPSINQPARLNSCFVIRDDSNRGHWRPVMDWENPIWGWVVVNYAEYGLQFFLADGTFYREVRMGGPLGANSPPAWLPFQPPDPTNVPGAAILQLDLLISKLLNEKDPGKTYLQSFINMINAGNVSTAAAPASYAEFMPAMIGKPMALVNCGYSLELATEPLENQSTLNDKFPDFPLLPPNGGTASPNTSYTFSLKLGDRERAYDGIIGYFDAVDSAPAPAPITANMERTASMSSGPASKHAQSEQPSSDLYLDQLYTYYASKTASTSPPQPDFNPTVDMTAPDFNYPLLQSYYIPAVSSDPAGITQSHNQQLRIFGVVMDAFTAVHAYTGILPVTTLKLPPWTVESAMRKMTFFFRAGPLVIPGDVPATVESDLVLKDNYSLDLLSQQDTTVVPDAVVPLPALKATDWNWLQPYYTSGAQSRVEFNALKIKQTDAAMRYDPGPYTAVEGYLQLAKPLLRPEIPQKNSPSSVVPASATQVQ